MQEFMKIAGKLVKISEPKIMAIVNLTTDSFFEESRVLDESGFLTKIRKFLAEGADIIDLGAYSTRPGAIEIDEETESQRLIWAIKLVKKQYPEAMISIDTFRAKVADECLAAGAHMINDISGGSFDNQMFSTIAKWQVPYILMHCRGQMHTFHEAQNYEAVAEDVVKELAQKVAVLRQMGVADVVIDPGFGFSKNIDQNYELLAQMNALKILDCPVLVGISRKSMIYKTLGITADEALNATTALHMWALCSGAKFLRVHDVPEAKQVVQLYEKMKNYLAK